ncbi:hypothetical protein ABWK22_02715 [Gottfriedia acidiceleris]|uniref:hypothetical protein n=1 Tax=Gottfriedia acidiceleris TaxID=371036 RepID=UPI0033950A62
MNILKWKGLEVDPMIISESVTTKAKISQVDTAFNESTNESGITVLYPKIEAIHAGRTRNFNVYTAEKLKGSHELKSGVYSWTQPYPKPVIHNHDVNTEATGRVYSASYSDITSAGRPGLIVTPKITQEKAIKDILEGRLLTVSIGATTNAAVCSVCGTDIINEGWCGHMRGEEYDGQMCEWVAGDLFFDELSWVNVPADSDAMITSHGLSNNMMTTGEATTVDGGVIVTGSVSAPKIKVQSVTTMNIADSTTLTPEPVVVTSNIESTEKEDDIVTQEDKVAVADEVVEEATPVTEEKDEATEDAIVTEETVVEEEKVEESTQETEQDKTPVTPEPVVTEQEDQASEELEAVKSELAEAQTTIEELTSANEQLAKELQEATVGFLVDLRVALGKESSRDDAISKYATRSMESLRDSISDILADKPSISKTRTVEHVEKPTGEIVTESKTLATESVRVISNEDALISLLTGRR